MITRDNYEEFFLLYIDDELSIEDREKVDAFLAENPDLKIEFTLLADTVLKPEALVYFKNKESLYKQPGEPDSISTENYETYFLEYTDNELDEAGKKEVEQFATKHPKLLLELSYYLQTKQEPDHAIIFPDKSLLYKKEETRKWVAMPWVRISAAAIVLVLLGLYVFSRYGQFHHEGNMPDRELAGSKSSSPKPVSLNPVEGLPKTSTDIKNSNPVTSVHPRSLDIKRVEYPHSDAYPPTARAGLVKAGQKSSQEQQPGQVAVNSATHTPNLTLAKLEPTASRKMGEPGSGTSPGMLKATAASELKQEETGLESTNDHPGTAVNYALQAVEDNKNTETDQVFYVTNSTSKKSKLRGIFRKVSRVFDKTAHVEDQSDKPDILIGGFQIALK